jgi:hypothetical protein
MIPQEVQILPKHLLSSAIKPSSVLVQNGLDSLVLVVRKYQPAQLESIDAVLMQQVGIQVQCQMHWMKLQMELFVLNGILTPAIGTRTYK